MIAGRLMIILFHLGYDNIQMKQSTLFWLRVHLCSHLFILLPRIRHSVLVLVRPLLVLSVTENTDPLLF